MSTAALDALALAGRAHSVLPASGLSAAIDSSAAGLPLPESLAGLLPEGVLRRGTTLQISGSTSLLLALLAEASRAGAWCAAVNLPTLGVAAAAGAGVDLDRFALVPAPGPSWSTVTAALLDAIDVVAIAVPSSGQQFSPAIARRLSARARERRGVLLVMNTGDRNSRWEGADADLSVLACQWQGVGLGHGHLQTRSLEVQSSGRRIGGRPRHARLDVASSGRVSSRGDVPHAR